MAVGQNPDPLVDIKIGGTWMFIHPKMARHMPHGPISSARNLWTSAAATTAKTAARWKLGAAKAHAALAESCRGP